MFALGAFNYLSNKADLKLISFVVCLQQFVKHINPQLQPCHINMSFLPYRCIKAAVNLSYHGKFLYALLNYYKCKYFKVLFHLVPHMVFVGNVQKSPIASHLKGLDPSLDFCCQGPALTGIKQGR